MLPSPQIIARKLALSGLLKSGTSDQYRFHRGLSFCQREGSLFGSKIGPYGIDPRFGG